MCKTLGIFFHFSCNTQEWNGWVLWLGVQTVFLSDCTTWFSLSVWESSHTILLPTLGTISFLKLILIHSYCSFNLHFLSDVEDLYVLICQCYLWWSVSSSLLPIFSNWVVYFNIEFFESSLCILDISPLSAVWFAYIFSACSLFLLFS